MQITFKDLPSLLKMELSNFVKKLGVNLLNQELRNQLALLIEQQRFRTRHH